MEDRFYSVTRRYYSRLSFYDKSYNDEVEENKWELYGAIMPPDGVDVVRTDMINNMGWAAKCDVHEGKFKDYKNSEYHTNCLTIVNNGGYIRNRNTICINNQDFTLACWFRLDPLYMSRFSDHDTEYITLCGWTDASGKKISIDVYVKDYQNILGNCTLRMYYDERYTEGHYKIPGTTPRNGKWMLFTLQSYDGYTLIHIDGKKIIETLTKDEFNIGTDLIDLKFGAFKKGSSGGIDIDSIEIMNDHISKDDFEIFDKPMYEIYPEEYFEDNQRSTEPIYYKSGKLYGLEFLHYENPSVSNGVLTFNSAVGTQEIIGLFMNNTYLDPSRYTRSRNIFTLKDTIDKSLASSAYFSLVVLKQEVANGFYVDVHQIEDTNSVPKIEGKINNDSFLLFDGSLALVQKDRYMVSGSSIFMTNPSDTLSNKLTLVYLRRKNDGPYKDSSVEINFGSAHGIISNTRTITFPPVQDFIEYTKSNMIFFINGTYIPASMFTLAGTVMTINSSLDDLTEQDIATAIYLISNEKPNIPWDILNYVNGSSQWDCITDSVDIVRHTNKIMDESLMYTKIVW